MVSRLLIIISALAAATQLLPAQVVNAKTCGVAPGENLVVFVGRKLSVRQFQPAVPPGAFLLDHAFRARYHVLQVFCGALTSPQIEFEAYDHYGTPAFAQFETVVLFVSREDGQFVQQKYQYANVYETVDGSWAGCGDPYQFEPKVHRGRIRAKPVKFKRPVVFSVAGLSEKEIRRRYSPQFFTQRGDSVICTAGATLAEIFAVKRNGVLKARELFR